MSRHFYQISETFFKSFPSRIFVLIFKLVFRGRFDMYLCHSPKMSMSMMMIFINSLVSYLSITKGWKEGFIDQKLNSFAAI